MTDISQNIRKYRKKNALSQDSLAERLNITRQAISNWETGKAYPDLDMLVRLSDVLETDPNSLIYPSAKDLKSKYRHVSFRAVLLTMISFFVVMTFGGGLFSMLVQSIVGGGVAETYIYPIYGGIVLLAGVVVFCTCMIIEEIRNYKYYIDSEENEIK